MEIICNSPSVNCRGSFIFLRAVGTDLPIISATFDTGAYPLIKRVTLMKSGSFFFKRGILPPCAACAPKTPYGVEPRLIRRWLLML